MQPIAFFWTRRKVIAALWLGSLATILCVCALKLWFESHIRSSLNKQFFWKDGRCYTREGIGSGRVGPIIHARNYQCPDFDWRNPPADMHWFCSVECLVVTKQHKAIRIGFNGNGPSQQIACENANEQAMDFHGPKWGRFVSDCQIDIVRDEWAMRDWLKAVNAGKNVGPPPSWRKKP